MICRLLILFCLALPKGTRGWIIKVDGGVPSHVARGDFAELRCDYHLAPRHALYSLKWYKDDKEFYRFIPMDDVKTQTFPMPGINVDMGNSQDGHVVLRSVERRSSGRYKCEVSAEAPSFDTAAFEGDLSVVDLPMEGPQIAGLRGGYGPGDRISVNCTAGPSSPPPTLHWYINDEKADPGHLSEHPVEHPASRGGVSVLGLDFLVRPLHFKGGRESLRIRCTASIASLYWQSHEEVIAPPLADTDSFLVLGSIGSGSSRGGGRRSSLVTWMRLVLLVVSFVLNYVTS